MSHFISQILNKSIEGEETICSNTEELIAQFEKINAEGGVSEDFIIGSTDVKALYPSLNIEFTIERM